jgi:elongation factor P--beta-lysine ligase
MMRGMDSRAPLAGLLACPQCLSQLVGGGCLSCRTDYPRIAGIPWLMPEPRAALIEWRGRLHHLLTHYAAEASRQRSALAESACGAATRRRLEHVAAALDDQAVRIRELMRPLGIERRSEAQAVHVALGTELPTTQGLSSYYTNLHRDWCWGAAENQAAAMAVTDSLPTGIRPERMLILGAGACRLAYDLHQSLVPALTVALDINPLYLRVSNELYLKRLITGGFPKVFEFAKNFRNEGIDRTHNPEFTLLEFYEAWADYNDMMVRFETLYAAACTAANGSPKFTFQGKEFDLTPPWPRLTVKQALKKYADIEVDGLSDDALKAECAKHHVELKGSMWLRGLAIKGLFEALCEPHLDGPIFITDHPRESTPLCKVHRDDPTLVEQFEPYINGWEVGNAYSELNDPVLQRKLLEDQVERGRGGEDETHPLDEDFLRALEYGMPPTGGVGIGIDRMIMLLTDSPTIKDVLLFPLMKPE